MDGIPRRFIGTIVVMSFQPCKSCEPSISPSKGIQEPTIKGGLQTDYPVGRVVALHPYLIGPSVASSIRRIIDDPQHRVGNLLDGPAIEQRWCRAKKAVSYHCVN